MRIKIYGYIMLISAVLIISAVPVLFRLANNMNPLMLVLLVSLIGAVFGSALVLVKGKQEDMRLLLKKKSLLYPTLAVGFLVFTVITIAFGIATHYISAALTAVVYRTWPLMMVAIAPFLLREKITKWDGAALLIGFSGLAFILIGDSSLSLPLAALPFVGIVLIAALADAVGSSLQKRYTVEIYSSIVMYNLVALSLFTLMAVSTNQFSLSGISATDWVGILLLGIFQNVLLAFFFVNSMRILNTAFAVNVYLICPFMTMVLGYIFLGEPILPAYLVVAATVFIGILVQKFAPRRSNYISKSRNRTFAPVPALYDITSAFVNTRNKKLYNVLKGSGRVLAFNKGPVDPETYRELMDSENESEDGCMLLSNKTHSKEFSSEELEYIKELMNHEDSDMIFVGAGHPNIVEKKLFALHDSFEANEENA